MGTWLNQAVHAPAFPPRPWLNGERMPSPGQLRGRVGLVFVWDYSCINSLRALPIVQAWYARYRAAGLEVIGVHTPRFVFGSEHAQLEWAVQRFDIHFPIFPDNDYRVWEAYACTCWPTLFLIDHAGYIRYYSEGAGAYEAVEAALHTLLREADPNVDLPPVMATQGAEPSGTSRRRATPELRAGLQGGALGNREGYASGIPMLYRMPVERETGSFYVSGAWQAGTEDFFYQGQTEGLVQLRYEGRSVYAVLSPHADLVERMVNPHQVDVEIWQDNRPLTEAARGADLTADGRVLVDRPRLYELIQNRHFGQHDLALRVHSRGFALYAFVFDAGIAS